MTSVRGGHRGRRALIVRAAVGVAVAASTLALGAAVPASGAPAAGAATVRAPAGATARRTLRVCADPNNMPFSDRKGRGFENHIATLVGHVLHEPVRYFWWAQRRGFIRQTLGKRRCDVVIGFVAQSPLVLTTKPYYHSTYVFVSRRARHYHIQSFDDPRLRTMRIGVHVIGDDDLPPGVALVSRGLVRNIVGYSIYGNYANPSPPSALIEAVARDDVDIAVAWGPLAGYYAKHSPVSLALDPVTSPKEVLGIPFVYPIAFGVRRGDSTLQRTLDAVIARHGAAIRAILRAYGVPLVDGGSSAGHPGPRAVRAARASATACVRSADRRRTRCAQQRA